MLFIFYFYPNVCVCVYFCVTFLHFDTCFIYFVVISLHLTRHHLSLFPYIIHSSFINFPHLSHVLDFGVKVYEMSGSLFIYWFKKQEEKICILRLMCNLLSKKDSVHHWHLAIYFSCLVNSHTDCGFGVH